MARQVIFDHRPAPLLTFVQEEATLRRRTGGRTVLRRQLEHLLELGQLRHVEIQVMPMEAAEHAGLGGSHRVLELKDGKTVGLDEVQLISGLISDPKQVQVLEMRYNLLRSSSTCGTSSGPSRSTAGCSARRPYGSRRDRGWSCRRSRMSLAGVSPRSRRHAAERRSGRGRGTGRLGHRPGPARGAVRR
ncbi:Scr1 family TA system antitoxin-like transcriptional regulator [Streptomyces microflavus]|uniref:Scr1 family TA system antitoxin-like transcriptional regulator n=1 Tax=Streptomyces microflavus TaxID=1919 RepID=UPI00369F3773